MVSSRLSRGVYTRIIGSVVRWQVDWTELLNRAGVEDSPGRVEAMERAELRTQGQKACRRRKKGKRM